MPAYDVSERMIIVKKIVPFNNILTFDTDVYEAISMKTCVEKRNTAGAPGPQVMEEEIRQAQQYLDRGGISL